LQKKRSFYLYRVRYSASFTHTFLQDYHAAAFFNSSSTIEKLIKVQSEVLYEVLNLIQEKNEKTAEDELETIARRHYQLGINKDTMFDSIDYYIDLLKLHQEELGLESTTIMRLKEMLDKTTADAYIEGIIDYTINFIINGDTYIIIHCTTHFLKKV
jgi:hypothetical protein